MRLRLEQFLVVFLFALQSPLASLQVARLLSDPTYRPSIHRTQRLS